MKKLAIAVDGDGKFELGAYVEARGQSLNPLMRRSGADHQLSEATGVPSGAARGGKQNLLGAAHANEKLWRGKTAQLDYEKRAGILCDRRGAVDAGMKAGETLQDSLRDRRRRLAEEIAGMTDPTEIEALIEREDAALLEQFTEIAKKMLQLTEGSNVAAA